MVPAVERPAAVTEAMAVELVEEPDKEQQRENLQKQAQLFMRAAVAVAVVPVQQKAAPVLPEAPASVSSATSERKEENT